MVQFIPIELFGSTTADLTVIQIQFFGSEDLGTQGQFGAKYYLPLVLMQLREKRN